MMSPPLSDYFPHVCGTHDRDGMNTTFDSDIACLAHSVGYARFSRKPVAVVLGGESCSVEEINHVIHDASELPILIMLTNPIGHKLCIKPSTIVNLPITHLTVVEEGNVEIHQDKSYRPPSPLPFQDSRMSLLRQCIRTSFRPVLLVGDGVSSIVGLPKTIPVVATSHSIDLVETSYRYFMGRFGMDGDRVGNFVVQNADLVIVVGHLPIEYPEWFAREACILWIHNTTEKPAFMTHAHFLSNPFTDEWIIFKRMAQSDWLNICNTWKEKYMNVLPPSVHDDNTSIINPYIFQGVLNDSFTEKESKIIVSKVDRHWWLPLFQQIQIRKGDRLIPTYLADTTAVAIGVANSLSSTQQVMVFVGNRNCFRLEDLSYIQQNKLSILLFCLHENNHNHGFQANNDGLMDWADNDTPVEQCLCLSQITDLTGIPHTELTKSDEIVEQIQKLKTHIGPILISVSCGYFVPYPRGLPEMPYEIMDPMDDIDIDKEMIVRPLQHPHNM